jgi:hypothetical protein
MTFGLLGWKWIHNKEMIAKRKNLIVLSVGLSLGIEDT